MSSLKHHIPEHLKGSSIPIICSPSRDGVFGPSEILEGTSMIAMELESEHAGSFIDYLVLNHSKMYYGEPPYDDDSGYGGIWAEINSEQQRFINEGEYAGDFVRQLHNCDEKYLLFMKGVIKEVHCPCSQHFLVSHMFLFTIVFFCILISH